GGDGLDLLPERHVVVVERSELVGSTLHQLYHLAGKLLGALGTLGPVTADHRFGAQLPRGGPDHLHLGFRIGDELVDGHDRRHAEVLHVAEVTRQVAAALLDRFDVLLAQILPSDASVHLEGADGGDHDGRVGPQAGRAALDVEELLGAHVRTETGLGHHIVRKLEGGAGGDHRVTAMRDVGEGTAVDDGRVAFQGLDEVRGDGVLQEHRHGPFGLQLPRQDRLAVAGIAHNDVAQALGQIVQIASKAEDRHDLGGNDDVEAVLPREAVRSSPQGVDDGAQGTVVHVDDAAPGDAAAVEAELVAPVDVVIDQRGQQVVRDADRMEVTGEVEVDVLHRHNLCIAATSRTALHAEAGPQRGFAEADSRALANAVQAITQTHTRRRLPFTRRGRGDRGDQDQLSVGAIFERLDEVEGDLSLVGAVLKDRL